MVQSEVTSLNLGCPKFFKLGLPLDSVLDSLDRGYHFVLFSSSSNHLLINLTLNLSQEEWDDVTAQSGPWTQVSGPSTGFVSQGELFS